MITGKNQALVEFETPEQAAQFVALVREHLTRDGGVQVLVGNDGYHATDAHRRAWRERDQYEPHDEVHTFRITFGQKFLREEHPVLAGLTGNDFVVIVADDEIAARKYTHAVFGDQWAFIYDSEEWETSKFFVPEEEPALTLVDPAFSMRFLKERY